MKQVIRHYKIKILGLELKKNQSNYSASRESNIRNQSFYSGFSEVYWMFSKKKQMQDL